MVHNPSTAQRFLTLSFSQATKKNPKLILEIKMNSGKSKMLLEALDK